MPRRVTDRSDAKGDRLALAAIRTDGGTQMRAQLDGVVIAEYAEAIREGVTFPPLVVVYDGREYWLADGFHRLEAERACGSKEVRVEVRAGTRRDAILCAAQAYAAHGLGRTNADKNRAVLTLLADAEWWAWSDREIARRTGVSNRFVSNLRDRLRVNGSHSEAAVQAQTAAESVPERAGCEADHRDTATAAQEVLSAGDVTAQDGLAVAVVLTRAAHSAEASPSSAAPVRAAGGMESAPPARAVTDEEAVAVLFPAGTADRDLVEGLAARWRVPVKDAVRRSVRQSAGKEGLWQEPAPAGREGTFADAPKAKGPPARPAEKAAPLRAKPPAPPSVTDDPAFAGLSPEGRSALQEFLQVVEKPGTADRFLVAARRLLRTDAAAHVSWPAVKARVRRDYGPGMPADLDRVIAEETLEASGAP